MEDWEFIKKVKEIRAIHGPEGLQQMREFLKQPGHLDRLFDMAEKGAKKKPVQHKARKSLPDGFPDQTLIDVATGYWAQSKRQDLVVDAQNQAQAFRDYHVGKGTLAADWPATWRTWMRNALRINKAPWGQPTPAEQPVTLEVWRWRVNAFNKGDGDSGIRPGYWKDAWGPKPGEPGCRAPN